MLVRHLRPASQTDHAAGGTAVWVTNPGADTIDGIDPTTSRALPPIPMGNDPLAIAAGPTGLWVTGGTEGTMTRIGQPR